MAGSQRRPKWGLLGLVGENTRSPAESGDRVSEASVETVSRRLSGRVLGGRYLIGPLVGVGAMGRVYRAHHVELGRTCAVKVMRIRDGQGADGDRILAVRRFRREAVAGARLDHPNVLRILDFGFEVGDSLFYLVTEHLDGEDLADVLAAERVLPLERIVEIGIEVTRALAHAHDRGVVHRDVKPENVRVLDERDDGERGPSERKTRIKLLDFGAALVRGQSEEPRGIGTPAYMAPEQISGGEVDGRADVYACGVMLFEMATGRLPFERSSPLALAEAHESEPPPAPRSLRSDVDPRLEEIILWCLRKDPAARPQSARQLGEALASVLRPPESRSSPGRSRSIRPQSTLAAPFVPTNLVGSPPFSRRPGRISALVLPCVAALLLALVLHLLAGPEDEAPEQADDERAVLVQTNLGRDKPSGAERARPPEAGSERRSAPRRRALEEAR
jgi:serine/threonine protein kinase